MTQKYTMHHDNEATGVRNEQDEIIAIKSGVPTLWGFFSGDNLISRVSFTGNPTAAEIGARYEELLAEQGTPSKTVTVSPHSVDASNSFVGEGVELMQIWLRTKLAYAAIELVQMSLDDRPRDEIYRAENDLAREIIEVVRHGKVEVV